MLQLLLLLHVLGAIIVFGPTFAFPIIASQAQKSPQNGAFAAALSELIERRIVIPGAIVQGITGLALIVILGVNPLTDPAWRWLLPGIVLYLIAVLFAIFVQARNAEKIVELTKNLQGPPSAEVGAEIAATGKALQRGGMLLTVLIVLIVLIMVTKPTI